MLETLTLTPYPNPQEMEDIKARKLNRQIEKAEKASREMSHFTEVLAIRPTWNDLLVPMEVSTQTLLHNLNPNYKPNSSPNLGPKFDREGLQHRTRPEEPH